MESDRYTELITNVNSAIERLENGETIVTSAANAGTADSANSTRMAKYASSDISKGTIEERLCKLGF